MVISLAHYVAHKGEYTSLYKVNKNVYLIKQIIYKHIVFLAQAGAKVRNRDERSQWQEGKRKQTEF